jgi:hypothetical protein
MTSRGKDSNEVVEFMMLFTRLKDWCDDEPDGLADFAESDSSIKEVCTKLALRAGLLRMSERRGRVLFASPVDPNFLAAWRDYEGRYQTVLSKIWLSDLFAELATEDAIATPIPDQRWEDADAEGEDLASGIEGAITFAQANIDQEHRWADQPEFERQVLDGLNAWERFKEETDFDLRGVFRRRLLVPFVLIPRHVAAKHSASDKHSMLRNLQQAHDAFIYGATYAALALMRSVMESVLRDHYGANGRDLEERIRNSSRHLPPEANEAALHRLRKLANGILHLDQDRDEGLPKLDDIRLEKEIVSLLFVLRALIEGARR